MMRTLLAAALLTAALGSGLMAPALAQTQQQTQPQASPIPLSSEEIENLLKDKNQLALFHYGSRYGFDVLLGGIAGGLVGAILRGGTIATITGSTLGSLLGMLWFLDGFAGEMIDKHGW